MNGLNIVLVEPEIPQNTGNVARTCAATGATLHLVHPLGFSLDQRSVRRAGLDYWDQVSVVEHASIESFISRFSRCPMWFFSKLGRHPYTQPAYEDETFLVFGCETRGLPRWIIEERADRTLRIPMRPGTRCLNLSNAVAVGAYEALRQHQFHGLQAVFEDGNGTGLATAPSNNQERRNL